MIKETTSKWKKAALMKMPEDTGLEQLKTKEIRKQKLEKYWKDKTELFKLQTALISFYINPDAFPVAPIALRKPQLLMELEIKKLEKENLLFTSNALSVFCVKGSKIPNLMHEIGRLREITFRGVGEGTNKSVDLDSFDQYYQQLFIWDNNARCVVGAYRIGLGKEIMAARGREGFYTQTLFKMNPNTDCLLEKSMEMGRSFVVEAYQRKALPLLFLWKGVLQFLMSKPEYRYLIGPVSISNEFTPLAQQLMVEMIQRQHNNYTYSQYISATHPFKFEFPKHETANLMNGLKDLNELDNFIKKTEGKRLPVLLKKYIQLGAKIACFNVDPLFNNSLDGFLILDLMAVPKEKLEAYTR